MERTGPPYGDDDPSGERPPDQGPQSPGGPQSPSGPPPGPQSPGGPQSAPGPQSPQSAPGPPPGPQSPGAPQSPSAFPPAVQSPGGPPAAPQSPAGSSPYPAPPQSPGGVQLPGGYSGPTPPGGWQQPMGAVATADPHHGAKFPLGRAWGFSILSFGLWGFYWFFNTRKQIDQELGTGRDDALLHTFGLLVPILNFFILYWLWRDISLVRQRAGLSDFSAGGYLVGAIFIAPLFYSLVLNKLNEYWDRRAGGVAPVRPVTTGEKVIVGIGAALLVLYVLFIIIIIIIGAAASTSSSSF